MNPYYTIRQNTLPENIAELLQKIHALNVRAADFIGSEIARWNKKRFIIIPELGLHKSVNDFPNSSGMPTASDYVAEMEKWLSCHVMTRIIADHFPDWISDSCTVQVCDGKFMQMFEHSWLTVFDNVGRCYIVDPQPIGMGYPYIRIGSYQLFRGKDIYQVEPFFFTNKKFIDQLNVAVNYITSNMWTMDNPHDTGDKKIEFTTLAYAQPKPLVEVLRKFNLHPVIAQKYYRNFDEGSRMCHALGVVNKENSKCYWIEYSGPLRPQSILCQSVSAIQMQRVVAVDQCDLKIHFDNIMNDYDTHKRVCTLKEFATYLKGDFQK